MRRPEDTSGQNTDPQVTQARQLNRNNYVGALGIMIAGASLAAEAGHATGEYVNGKGLDLDPSFLVGAIVGLSIVVLSELSSPRR